MFPKFRGAIFFTLPYASPHFIALRQCSIAPPAPPSLRAWCHGDWITRCLGHKHRSQSDSSVSDPRALLRCESTLLLLLAKSVWQHLFPASARQIKTGHNAPRLSFKPLTNKQAWLPANQSWRQTAFLFQQTVETTKRNQNKQRHAQTDVSHTRTARSTHACSTHARPTPAPPTPAPPTPAQHPSHACSAHARPTPVPHPGHAP